MSDLTLMSKKFHIIRQILGVFGLTLQFFTFAAAQDMSVSLSARESPSTPLLVRGQFETERSTNERHVLAFSESIAGVSGLRKRIADIKLLDFNGRELDFVESSCCAIATGTIKQFSYTVSLDSTDGIRAEAHTSWLRNGKGVLMFGDILPQEFGATGKSYSASVTFDLPREWIVRSSDLVAETKVLRTDDIGNSIAFIGGNWRVADIDIDGQIFKIVLSGEHHFSDSDVADKVRAIVGDYSGKFGKVNGRQFVVSLFSPRKFTQFNNWEADARGKTVVIATSGMPFKSQTIQQLDAQLRHELFHLWIPNGVSLSGRYDWFYEGFALYSSLKLAVRSNTIRFDDMLDTMKVAISAGGATPLIEAAKQRYNGYEREMYSRGLRFAFLCDLAMNIESKGKRDSDFLVRKLFQTYKLRSDRTDGNEAVVRMLNENAELRPLVQHYVFGDRSSVVTQSNEIDNIWENAGLELSFVSGTQKLAVKAKLTSRQKAILDNLGYNSWRKLLKDSK